MNESSVDDRARPRNYAVPIRKPKDKPERIVFCSKGRRLLKLYVLGLRVTQTYKKPFQSHTCSSNLSIYHSSLQALISLIDDHSLLSNMAALESCPKHNMIAYLEKTEGNVEFHEVIDFLQRSYISHALTVSPVVSTTFVEQFWTSAKSKTINNARHITAKVAGKLVSISEASIRTDLLFDDADGIDTLPNQAIFDAIQLMGYEGDLTDEGASSESQSVEQPSPSPTPTGDVPNESLPDSTSAQPSEVPFEHAPDHPQDLHPCTIPDSIPNHMVIILEAKEIQALKAQITKLKKQAKLVIKHHKAYLKSVSLQQRFLRKSFSKKHNVHKESETENAQLKGGQEK
ncbi:hypothetical protein Tco_1020989 [Tanacetum coccineum]